MLLTRKELAEKLGLNIRTVDNLAKKGMPRLMIGGSVRFIYEDVIAWIKENSRKRG